MRPPRAFLSILAGERRRDASGGLSEQSTRQGRRPAFGGDWTRTAPSGRHADAHTHRFARARCPNPRSSARSTRTRKVQAPSRRAGGTRSRCHSAAGSPSFAQRAAPERVSRQSGVSRPHRVAIAGLRPWCHESERVSVWWWRERRRLLHFRHNILPPEIKRRHPNFRDDCLMMIRNFLHASTCS